MIYSVNSLLTQMLPKSSIGSHWSEYELRLQLEHLCWQTKMAVQNRDEVIGKKMSVLEKCRQLLHKQPEPQRVHTHSTGSAVRDPLVNNLSQWQCYQKNGNFTASTSLNMSAGFTHSYNAASYSTIGRKTSCSLPESPSTQPSRDSHLHILKELTRHRCV